jgi:orotidine-5'-phosphate decarboxylase
MNFYERLHSIQQKKGTLLCIGLDTDLRRIPKPLLASDNPVVEFNRRIVEATRDVACAYKLNLAFYESLGEGGWRILHQTLAGIPGDCITIGDGKRGDIGNTAEMYAKALFHDFAFTAATVNPYMGTDSIAPFLSDEKRGAFVLAVTSNPGARDFQYLRVKGIPLYERVVAMVKKWNSRKNCGLVVGATRPHELRRVRELVPDMPILIPGIGTQGGDLRRAVRHGCDRNGALAIINASRSIIYASMGEDFAEAARTAATTLRDEINVYRDRFF